jgi:hypothetical protein
MNKLKIVLSSSKEVDFKRTPLSSSEASQFLSSAWRNIYGNSPTEKQIAILTAQWAHETGNGRSMIQWNFGGIKGVGPSGLTVKARTKEGYGKTERVIRDSFRAYANPEEGALDYLKFMKSNFPTAMDKVLEEDPGGFVRELKSHGYFTGSEKDYIKSVESKTSSFLERGFDGKAEETLQKKEQGGGTVYKFICKMIDAMESALGILDSSAATKIADSSLTQIIKESRATIIYSLANSFERNARK